MESQDGARIGRASHAGRRAGKLAAQRDVVKRFFHAGGRPVKPLLHLVNAQHPSKPA
jgi:hypothetical protein